LSKLGLMIGAVSVGFLDLAFFIDWLMLCLRPYFLYMPVLLFI
jgi:hypothetical protein